jgi:hypothetical protein
MSGFDWKIWQAVQGIGLPGLPTPLADRFGWAGKKFPFNGGSGETTDLVATTTSWSDSSRFRRYRTLTINSGITLTIARFPFYLFCDELAMGATGIISANGNDGQAVAQVHNASYARGAAAGGAGLQQGNGGDGGGLIVIVCRRLNCSSGALIRANGGAGNAKTTDPTAESQLYSGGQGALASSYGAGPSPASGFAFINQYLAPGGSAVGGAGGMSGTSGGNVGGGGSGIGGGGSGGAGAGGAAGGAAVIPPGPKELLALAEMGCLGGGGGGASSGGANGTGSSGGGGGGGGILVIYDDLVASSPTLQANGGAGGGPYSPFAGSAGVTHLLEI